MSSVETGSAAGATCSEDSPRVSAPTDWFDLMRRGDFAQAWELSDQTLRARRGVPCWQWPRHLQYIWDGSPLEGKRVLVRCYHGLGDTVQFIRYAAPLKKIARKVIVWAQPPLQDLLTTVAGIDRLLPLHDGVPEVEYEADVELMELPHVFRSTLETLPCAVPYVCAVPADLDQYRASRPSRDSGQMRVGLVWRSGDWDPRRSVPAQLLWPLAEMDGVELFILQHGPALTEWPGDRGVVIGEHSVHGAARLIRAMDLMITVDTLAAHLAGALGVAVWTLLPAEADWRWLTGRDDSPWYPTMRLFRQGKPGDWAPVIDHVRAELTTVLTQRDPIGGKTSRRTPQRAMRAL